MTGQESSAIRHLNLVRMIVNRYFMGLDRFGYTYDDLVQEGLLAVMIAEPQYNPERGEESTFYYRAIRHRLSWRIVKRGLYGRQRANLSAVELDKPIACATDTTDTFTIMDTLIDPASDFEQGAVDRMLLARALKYLAHTRPRELSAINLRFWDDMSLQEVGAAMGVTRQRAEQLIKQGLRHLRGYMGVQQGGQTA